MESAPVLRPEFASVEARRMEFPGQQPGERVLSIARPGATLWLSALPMALLIGAAAWGLFQLVAQAVSPGLSLRDERAILVGIAAFLLAPAWYLLVSRYTHTLVTDRRVVCFSLRFPGTLVRRVVPLGEVKSVSVEARNPLLRFFGVGKVLCDGTVVITHATHAEELAAYIERIRTLALERRDVVHAMSEAA